MWVNSKNPRLAPGQLRHLERRQVQRQLALDWKEFLWQVHPEQLSARDWGRFNLREAAAATAATASDRSVGGDGDGGVGTTAAAVRAQNVEHHKIP
eukprot:COSAG05_NODE_9585_length_613_cov_124254.474708_1_plen_95_part_10